MARQNSNVFAMFDQKQIAELKEAFTFIDQNADGFIDREDLVEIWTSLGNIFRKLEITLLAGQDPSDELIEGMIGETGPLSFTLFLTLMGERVQGGDAESDILEAFEQFDERNTGMLSMETMRSILTTGQDKMTDDEVQ